MTDSGDAMEEELVDFSGSEYEFDADLVLEEEEDASTSIKNEAVDAKNVVAGKTGDHLPGIQDTEKEFLDDASRVNDIPSNNRCEPPANPVGENSKEAQANGDPAQQSAGEAVDRSAAATADLEDGEFDDKASVNFKIHPPASANSTRDAVRVLFVWCHKLNATYVSSRIIRDSPFFLLGLV